MPTNHAGKLMVIQYAPVTPGVYVNLCGINETTMNITNEVSEEQRVQCADRSQLVETIRAYGAQSITFDANGLFDSDAAGQFAADTALAQTVVALRGFVPGWGYIESASWFIPSCSWSGSPTGSLTHAVSFAASGAITFTAV